MSSGRAWVRFGVAAVLAAAVLASHPASADSRHPRCEAVGARGYLNVLTINLLFSEFAHRDERLEDVADFAVAHDVDAIFLQEVVGGRLAGTANSAMDLQQKLAERDAAYELRSAIESGVPGVGGIGNAILSRCDIVFYRVKRLPPGTEDVGDAQVQWPRNVLLARVAIPGYGRVNLYDTHLCASCDPSERDRQLTAALDFIGAVESRFRRTRGVVFAGDFNLDRFRDSGIELPLYDKIIGYGFADAYAVAQAAKQPPVPLDELCPLPKSPDEHCTVGVSNFDDVKNARRIDYVFAAGLPVQDGRVVFNTVIDQTQPSVSDHAGVFIQLRLP